MQWGASHPVESVGLAEEQVSEEVDLTHTHKRFLVSLGPPRVLCCSVYSDGVVAEPAEIPL